MKKYPFVKQSSYKDCAGACMQMILKYYNGYVTLDKLNYLLCTNNKGTTAFHIVSVLKTLGFSSCGYKYNNLSSLKVPSIAHINKNSYNHYVVIYDINFKKKKILIGDPAEGIINMNFDKFNKMWTGIVIEMSPIRDIIKEKQPNICEFILRLLKGNIKYLIILGLLSLLISICILISSFFLQGIITYINNMPLRMIFVFYFVFLFKTVLNYMRNLILIMFNKKIDKKISLDMYYQIINLPYRYYKNKTTGEIVSYFNDLSLIKNVISTISYLLFLDLPLIIILFIFFLFTDYQLLTIGLFVLSLFLMVHLSFRKKLSFNTSYVLKQKALINSNIVESIKGFETIKGLSLEESFNENFKEKYLDYLKASERFERLKSKEIFFKDLVDGILLFLFAFYSLFALKKGIPASMIITIFSLSTLLSECFKDILDFDFQFQNIISTINHIEEILLEKNAKNNIHLDGNIVIKNLNYSLDGIRNILSNINLTIKKGSKVFVTGESGSGKSSLCKIIKGYYDNYEGSINIGGIDIRRKNSSKVVYVSDREVIFTGLIKDNLNIRKYDLASNEICEISSFVDENDVVEEDGFNLSSGQRQRIALARALSDFNILIIDEGLSQVDVNMERRILKNLLGRYQSQTIIFVSHRTDNLDLFDRLLKLENGQVVLDSVYSD